MGRAPLVFGRWVDELWRGPAGREEAVVGAAPVLEAGRDPPAEVVLASVELGPVVAVLLRGRCVVELCGRVELDELGGRDRAEVGRVAAELDGRPKEVDDLLPEPRALEGRLPEAIALDGWLRLPSALGARLPATLTLPSITRPRRAAMLPVLTGAEAPRPARPFFSTSLAPLDAVAAR